MCVSSSFFFVRILWPPRDKYEVLESAPLLFGVRAYVGRHYFSIRCCLASKFSLESRRLVEAFFLCRRLFLDIVCFRADTRTLIYMDIVYVLLNHVLDQSGRTSVWVVRLFVAKFVVFVMTINGSVYSLQLWTGQYIWIFLCVCELMGTQKVFTMLVSVYMDRKIFLICVAFYFAVLSSRMQFRTILIRFLM